MFNILPMFGRKFGDVLFGNELQTFRCKNIVSVLNYSITLVTRPPSYHANVLLTQSAFC